MNHLPHLAQRVFNTPLMIHPAKAEIIIAALSERFGINQLRRANGSIIARAGWELWEEDEPQGGNRNGYEIVEGVAVIEISGNLVQKLGTLNPYSGMTGYDGIRQNFITAMLDPKVRAIAFVIASPGGEVAGCFDLVDVIYQARGTKPIWGILDETACSAAFAIASACDVITLPRTGFAGSVGVVCCHVDFSKALDAAGVVVTFFQYGARKTDGNEYQALSPEASIAIQRDVDTMGDLFVTTVARNRKLDPTAVKATEADIFMGNNAVNIGFADYVLSPAQAFQQLINS